MQKEGQSAIKTVGHQWAWMVFPYKTDSKKAKVLQGRQLSWTELRKFTANIKNRILQRLTDHLSVKLNPSMANHNGKRVTLIYLFFINIAQRKN